MQAKIDAEEAQKRAKMKKLRARGFYSQKLKPKKPKKGARTKSLGRSGFSGKNWSRRRPSARKNEKKSLGYSGFTGKNWHKAYPKIGVVMKKVSALGFCREKVKPKRPRKNAQMNKAKGARVFRARIDAERAHQTTQRWQSLEHAGFPGKNWSRRSEEKGANTKKVALLGFFSQKLKPKKEKEKREKEKAQCARALQAIIEAADEDIETQARKFLYLSAFSVFSGALSAAIFACKTRAP